MGSHGFHHPYKAWGIGDPGTTRFAIGFPQLLGNDLLSFCLSLKKFILLQSAWLRWTNQHQPIRKHIDQKKMGSSSWRLGVKMKQIFETTTIEITARQIVHFQAPEWKPQKTCLMKEKARHFAKFVLHKRKLGIASIWAVILLMDYYSHPKV